MPVVLADVVDEPLDVDALVAAVDDPRAGAVVSFVGVVRDHDHGRSVRGIRYVGHPSASDVIAQLAAEVAARDEVCAVVARHRVGDLVVGDAAVVLAVSAEHRAEAFDGCRELIERIKQSLPLWKQQTFIDGVIEWSECP